MPRSAPPEPGDPTTPDPATLHHGLWRASHLGVRAVEPVTPTGWPALDAVLPGGGWPHGSLTELLLPAAGVGEMRLLAPALLHCAGPVMLFDPPALPCAWALAQLRLYPQRLIVVRPRAGAGAAAGPARNGSRAGVAPPLVQSDVLWALQQALRGGCAGARLAWLPDALRGDALRRLQVAAASHPGPVFVLRPIAARQRPSPAPLRLAVHADGLDVVRLQVLKRRGPPVEAPLRLALMPVHLPVQGLPGLQLDPIPDGSSQPRSQGAGARTAFGRSRDVHST